MYQHDGRRRSRRHSRKLLAVVVAGTLLAFGSLTAVGAQAAYVPNGCKAGQAQYKAYSGATRSCAPYTGKGGGGTNAVAPAKGGGGASGSTWDKLAQCESSGKWNTNTGNGYQGGLQFSPSTWKAFGGKGSAANASKAEQIRVATEVQKGQGWGAWPSCSKKLGLR